MSIFIAISGELGGIEDPSDEKVQELLSTIKKYLASEGVKHVLATKTSQGTQAA